MTKLYSPSGAWKSEELRGDPFRLVEESKERGYVQIKSNEPPKLASALMLPDGVIGKIVLGEFDHNRENQIQVGENGPTQWLFQTSGTSGEPKLVVHTLKSITRQGLQNSESPKTWSFLTDPCRMAGFQVVLEAIRRNDDLVIPNFLESFQEKIKFLLNHRVTHLACTPSQARMLLSVPQSKNLHLSQMTLGGEIVDQPLISKLIRQFASIRVTHVYATTELGPVFAVSDLKAGFPMEYASLKRGRLCISENGELGVIKSPSETFWTGDLVEEQGDRYFFSGRISSLINVGGAKVSPERVERVLADMPWIEDLRVFGKKSATLGQIVAVEIVAGWVPENYQKEIIEHCADRLSRHEIPQWVVFVDEVQKNNTQKRARSG